MSDPIGDPNCPTCGGAGWVRVADGGAGAASLCKCTKRTGLVRNVRALGIPPKFQLASFENFNVRPGAKAEPSLLAALQTSRQYVAEFLKLDGSCSKSGLLFIGIPGIGKTHLAVATLRAVVGAGMTTGRFLDFTSFVSELQSTFDPSNPESKHDLLDPVLNTGLLVLDDLGARQPTPFVHEILYLIVNTRYVNQRPTIFTTNLQLEPPATKTPGPEREAFSQPLAFDQSESGSRAHLLSNRLQPLLVSRLFEMTKPVVLTGEDYRKKKGSLLESPA